MAKELTVHNILRSKPIFNRVAIVFAPITNFPVACNPQAQFPLAGHKSLINSKFSKMVLRATGENL